MDSHTDRVIADELGALVDMVGNRNGRPENPAAESVDYDKLADIVVQKLQDRQAVEQAKQLKMAVAQSRVAELLAQLGVSLKGQADGSVQLVPKQ